MTKIFFADTYALVEIVGGNKNYKHFMDYTLITTQFNLIELYYYFLRDFDVKTADRYLKVFSKIVVPVSNTSIRRGMKFKLKHKKEKLSYVDCIGYALSTELGVQFLTGDVKFEHKERVEYVK